jgi:hypothetical protein
VTGPGTGPVWRYLLGGSAKHALYAVSDPSAVCGVSPLWYVPEHEGHWRGTGSEAEHRRLGQLRECRRCTRTLRASRG